MALFDRKDNREEDKSSKEPVIEDSIIALGSKDWEKRQDAAIRLSQAGKPAVVPLLKALNDDNSLIRTGAAEILGTYGEPAIPTLMKLLVTGKERVRDGAARAIGQTGQKAIKPLKEALKSNDYKSRRGAALALGYLGYLGDEVTKLLVRALLDKNPQVSRQAAKSLSNMKWKPANNREAAHFYYAIEDYDTLAKTGKEGVEVLSVDLKNPDPKVRKRIAGILKKIKSDEILKPLSILITDKDAVVRHAAVEAIGEINDPRLLPHLVKSLDDEDPSVRVEASWSLERTGWKPANSNEKARFLMVKERWADLVQMRESAVPILIQGLCDENPGIRLKCTEVLRAMGSVGYAAINEALKSKDPAIRKAAKEAAARIKEKDSQSAKKKKPQPKDKEKETKDESIEEQLKRQKASMGAKESKIEVVWIKRLHGCGIEGERAERLAKAFCDQNDIVRSAAIENLKQSGIASTDCILYLMLDKKDSVRIAAIEALGDLKSKKAAPYIAKTLGDENSNVRMASAHSLGLIQEPKSIPSLIKCFSDSNQELRKESAIAVSKIGSNSLPYLKKAIESSDLDARITALESLGRITDPLAISLAVRMLNDREYDVRASAVATLQNMSDLMFNALMDEARRIRVQGNEIEKNGIIMVLAGIEDLRAKEILAEFTADSNENVRLKALGYLGDEAEAIIEKVAPEGAQAESTGIGKLINALRSSDTMVQMEAVEKISLLGDSAIKPLINSIDDKSPEFQNLVAEILTGMGDPALKGMIKELKTGRPSVKIILAQNLAKIPEDRTIKALCEVLYEENDPIVRMVAAESLGFIGDKQGLDALIFAVTSDEDTRVKSAAIVSLGYFSDQKAIETLISVLDSEDYSMCKKASESLKNSGNDAIPYLLDALTSGEHKRNQIAFALESLSWVPETERDIIFYLAAKENWEEIERIGEQAIEDLTELLDDSNPEFRAGVVEVIEKIDGEASIQPLIHALGDSSTPVRIKAENALLGKGKPAIPYLEKAVVDTDDPNVRTFAMKLIKKIES